MVLTQKLNKKGASFSGWSEGIILTLLTIVAFTVIFVNFNSDYDRNYNPIGNLTDNKTLKDFNNLQEKFSKGIAEGETDVSGEQGVTLKSAPSITYSAVRIIWTFFTGSWIDNSVGLLPLGSMQYAVALTLKILFFLSISFFLLTIIFKVML